MGKSFDYRVGSSLTPVCPPSSCSCRPGSQRNRSDQTEGSAHASEVDHQALAAWCCQVLNLLLFKLTKRPYDEALLEFLAADEHLVDINDDLVDYEVGPLTGSLAAAKGKGQRP